MDFPRSNKIPTGFVASLKERAGENAALLQELIESIQWRVFFRFYCAIFGIFLVSLFLVIAVVRLALLIP